MDSAQNNNSQTPPQILKLEELVGKAQLPDELKENLVAMVARLKLIAREANFFAEYDTISRYIHWTTSLPWKITTKDNLDLKHAREVLEKNHHGIKDVKEKILEYLSIMILTTSRTSDSKIIARAPIISLVGLVGTGKTTIALSIAEALGRRFVRIPFGGMGSAAQLRGKSRMSPDAEPGLIIKALKRAGTNNPVLLLDEIDRVSSEARADIMGVLVELLDPEQNKEFVDHFIDYPVNLTQVLFIATSNNTKDISTAVMDRLEVIQMPSYSDDEKIYIAKNYILPKVLKESGVSPQELGINDSVWSDIVRPLGYDSGIRSLQRTIQGLVRKVVHYRLEGKIAQEGQFVITSENVKQFVPQW